VIRQPGERLSDRLTLWALTAAPNGTGYCLDGAGKRTFASNPYLKARIFNSPKGHLMNNIVYIVGAIVIIIAILSFFGLR
jgi:hypothetical protein